MAIANATGAFTLVANRQFAYMLVRRKQNARTNIKLYEFKSCYSSFKFINVQINNINNNDEYTPRHWLKCVPDGKFVSFSNLIDENWI